MIFVVIGPTGSGKTNFINILAGASGDGGAANLNDGTRSITSQIIEHDGRRLVFVDTPGLDSTYLPDAAIFNLVAKWLEIKYRPNIEIGIIYLHRITDTRIQVFPHEHIEMLRKQCSSVAVRQICLVTTMWDNVDDTEEADSRERFLKEGFQKKSVCQIFNRFDNQRSSAWDIMRGLIRDHLAITIAPNHLTPDSMIFLVMGPTGSGKTNFITTLTGTSGNGGSASLSADTQSVIQHVAECDGRHLVFVDTPGFDSTYLPNAEIFTLVAKWLKTNYRTNIEIGIIYFYSITDNGNRGSPHAHIEMLRKRCSSVVVRQICLVTTMWDHVDETAEAEMREEFLKDDFQRKNVCETFKRFNNQRSSAWDIMSELIRGHLAITTTPNLFLVLGSTGSGKTNFISTLTGLSGNGGSASLNADTQSVIQHVAECDGRRLVFVDTPGLNSTYLPDVVIFRLVAKWLETNYRTNIEIGIIYLHRITDDRIQGSPPHDHIEMFRKQCSGMAVHQICLVTTMWDNVDETAEADMREEFLRKEFQKRNIRVLFKKFDNQPSTARDIVRELMGREARRLQEELEDRERRSNEPGTAKASYIRSQQLLSQRMEVLQHLIAQAAIEGNVSRVQDLRAELDRLDSQIRLTFEEMRERNISLIRRVLQWLARKLGTTDNP